ncbi:MAG: hypothetical protein WCW65_01245 [Candidatus Paceibacterota bacterium]
MRLINQKIKSDGGYAILFTVVVVGIISMITIGLSNAAYKQMILSSVAKDSTTAFYQADIASECALYADNTEFLEDTKLSDTFICAGNTNLKYSHVESTEPALPNDPRVSVYNLDPLDGTIKGKCSRITITKRESTTLISTQIQSMGYNICNKSNLRTVERAIEVNY